MAVIFYVALWLWIADLAKKSGIVPEDATFAWDTSNPIFQLRAMMIGHVFFYWLDVVTPPSGLGKLQKRVEELERQRSSGAASDLYSSYTPGVSRKNRY